MIDSLTLQSYSNFNALIKKRQQLACENIYIAESYINFNTAFVDSSELIRDSVIQYMKLHCPESLKQIRYKEK